MIPKIKKKRFTRKDKVLFYREEKYDFMKHWSVIRKWAVINYELKSSSREKNGGKHIPKDPWL